MLESSSDSPETQEDEPDTQEGSHPTAPETQSVAMPEELPLQKEIITTEAATPPASDPVVDTPSPNLDIVNFPDPFIIVLPSEIPPFVTGMPPMEPRPVVGLHDYLRENLPDNVYNQCIKLSSTELEVLATDRAAVESAIQAYNDPNVTVIISEAKYSRADLKACYDDLVASAVVRANSAAVGSISIYPDCLELVLIMGQEAEIVKWHSEYDNRHMINIIFLELTIKNNPG